MALVTLRLSPAARTSLSLSAVALLLSLMPACLSRDEGGSPDPASDGSAPTEAGSFLPSDLPPAQPSPPPPGANLRPEEVARWERNPDRAFHKAKALDRPLLMLFTGLAWSENARTLGDEVFLSRSFNAFARQELALAFLDYPRNPSNAPPALRKLKERFRVSGFPTIIVLDPSGLEIHRQTGYAEGKPRDYFEELHRALKGTAPDYDALLERSEPDSPSSP